MKRQTRSAVSFWECEHFSPVVVEKADGGAKKIARCLLCGEIGPVCEGSEEALRALRDRARLRDEAQSA